MRPITVAHVGALTLALVACTTAPPVVAPRAAPDVGADEDSAAAGVVGDRGSTGAPDSGAVYLS
jgi:hypothetical protein